MPCAGPGSHVLQGVWAIRAEAPERPPHRGGPSSGPDDDAITRHCDRTLTDEQKRTLDGLLTVPAGERVSPLEFLKKPPAKPSPNAMKMLCTKLAKLEEFRAPDIDVGKIGPSRLRHIARDARGKSAYELGSQTQAPLRYAQLASFLAHTFVESRDRAVDMFLRLVQKYVNRARDLAKEDLRILALNRTDSFNRVMAFTSVFAHSPIPYERRMEEAYGRVPETRLAEDLKTLGEEVEEPDRSALAYLDREFTEARKFAPPFLNVIQDFEFQPGKESLKDATAFLRQVHRKRSDKKLWKEAPVECAITVGCTRNAELSSPSVLTPFTASNASLALNSSECFFRF